MPNEITVQDKEVKNLIRRLKRKTIGFYDVPIEYRQHPLIVKIERDLGIRKSTRRGYDVIRKVFFVEEEVLSENIFGESNKCITNFFYNFSSYYEFLQGDIYENACYYKYCFSQEEINKYSLDLTKLNFVAFIDYTIDDFTLEFSTQELKQYEEIEEKKKLLISGLDELYACSTYVEFSRKINELKSQFPDISREFFLYNFIFYDKEKAFKIVMQYINNISSYYYERGMCLIYEPQAVFSAYNNVNYAPSTAQRYKRRLKYFIEDLENKAFHFSYRCYFDENTHFYVFRYIGYIDLIKFGEAVEVFRYFKTFEEFADFRKNDLSYCDLSKAKIPNLDLSKYKIGNRTRLPIQYQKNLTYTVNKFFDRNEDCFIVNQDWVDEKRLTIKSYNHSFKYLSDFVHFLKCDLSDADLLFCDGLSDIDDFIGINFTNARLKSEVLDKLGLHYEVALNNTTESFPVVLKNEEETINALTIEREKYSFDDEQKCQKIYYISDLHLLHRLINSHCKTNEDIVFTIQKIVDSILDSVLLWGKDILLIGGDTSSDFAIFNQFVCMLRTTLDKRGENIHIIFTLGNHEIWDFAGCTFDEIVAKYQKVISENKMYLLQNNIIFKYDWNNIESISTDELKVQSQIELQKRLQRARIILFGGLGFAGYNEEFNANQGIYRQTIDRNTEIEESKKFNELYKKVCSNLADNRIIVFTHNPQKDWCEDAKLQKGFVYVSGHTHRNYFYDDGDYRIYADNQVGYKQVNVRLKYFYIDDDYDTFVDYEDGIYEISRDDYTDFYSGKNLYLMFNREFFKLFMLKKNGYYMFILQNKSGGLTILNGGSLKKLEHKDINYYYENMDKVIDYIKTPLDKYTEYQKRISDEIKGIGGSGEIHGAIVDIDFFNHIYVNPIDLTVTAYSASDIINKIVYPDVPALLKDNCKELYLNYIKQIENSSSNAIVLKGTNSELVKAPKRYLDTDIYRASREIKKMQKLSSNILSIWIEPTTKKLSDKNE